MYFSSMSHPLPPFFCLEYCYFCVEEYQGFFSSIINKLPVYLHGCCNCDQLLYFPFYHYFVIKLAFILNAGFILHIPPLTLLDFGMSLIAFFTELL